MSTNCQIEEALVRLEERALELTMAQAGELTKHEHDCAHAEARALRPLIDQMGGEYVRRLDRVQVELMCIRKRWFDHFRCRPKAA